MEEEKKIDTFEDAPRDHKYYNEGDELIRMKNGGIMNKTQRKIIKGPQMTSEQARALQRKRHEVHREHAEIAVSRAAGKGKLYYEAFERMVEAQYNIATNTSQGKSAVMAFNQLLKVLDAVPSGQSRRSEPDQDGITVGRRLSLELADKLIAWADRRQAELEKANVIDV